MSGFVHPVADVLKRFVNLSSTIQRPSTDDCFQASYPAPGPTRSTKAPRSRPEGPVPRPGLETGNRKLSAAIAARLATARRCNDNASASGLAVNALRSCPSQYRSQSLKPRGAKGAEIGRPCTRTDNILSPIKNRFPSPDQRIPSGGRPPPESRRKSPLRSTSSTAPAASRTLLLTLTVIGHETRPALSRLRNGRPCNINRTIFSATKLLPSITTDTSENCDRSG